MKLSHWIIPVVVIASLAEPASAQTDTTFNYQAELMESGSPANGAFNVDFTLWDDALAGAQIGSPVMFNGLAIVDGRFTVELDYGPLAFDNTGRWLEVSVNSTTLTPRQPITRSPYSIQTRGIFVDADHNVGIGTTTPLADLYIDGTGSTDAALIMHEPGASTGELIFGSPAGAPGIVALATNGNRRDIRFSDQGIDLLTSSTIGSPVAGHGLVIDENGKIGIGTTTPDDALHITSPGAGIHVEDESAASEAEVYLGEPGDSGFKLSYSSQSNQLQFIPRAVGADLPVALMIERNTGRVGIGTIPIYAFHVRSDDTAILGHSIAASGLTHAGRFQNESTDGRGILGETTANSGATIGVWGISNSSSGFDFYASGAGVDYGTNSSIRWKRNVINIEDPLYKLSMLRGVYFDWDDEHGGQHDVGMIAEEVGAVMPEIVNYEENGIDAIGMDYSKMTPLLVEAVNALQEQFEYQLAAKDVEIRDLHERIAAIENRFGPEAGTRKD